MVQRKAGRPESIHREKAMRLRISMTLLSGLVLAGCSPVFVDEPIGKQVELDMEHIEKIEGRWQAGDSLFQVEHRDGGRFKVTKIETDPEKTKEKSTTAIITRKHSSCTARASGEVSVV